MHSPFSHGKGLFSMRLDVNRLNSTMDMTRGRPLSLLVRFGLPLMLSSILQQLYSLCDSMVVGRLIGVEAFAAVGAASFLNWLPLSMLLGLSQGFAVVLSQRFGAGDARGLKRSAWLSAAIGSAAAILMGALGILFLYPLLTAMHTPAEMLELSAAYLRVVFAGLIASALYNVAATLLRAAGDSRTPLLALAVSTLCNIALDYILVAFANMGVEGVALATVLAQLISLTVCLARIILKPIQTPEPSAPAMTGGFTAQLFRNGLSPMFRDGVIAVGGLFVQTVVNGFGVTFVAGMTAARRYFSMMEMVGAALEGALATFVGQNAGANRPDRIREGTRTAVQLGVIAALLTAILAAVFANPLITLLIGSASPEVVQYGVTALRLTALFLPFLYLLCLYRASLQSMGDALTPMLSGFAELIMRLLSVLLLPPFIGHVAAYMADDLGWVAAAILLMTVYYQTQKRLMNQ